MYCMDAADTERKKQKEKTNHESPAAYLYSNDREGERKQLHKRQYNAILHSSFFITYSTKLPYISFLWSRDFVPCMQCTVIQKGCGLGRDGSKLLTGIP